MRLKHAVRIGLGALLLGSGCGSMKTAKPYDLGVAFSKQGDYPKAERAYQEAIRLDPTDAKAYNNLGVALARQEKYAEAEKAFREAVRLKRDFAAAYFNLGNAHLEQNQHGEAVQAFREAARLNPRDGEALKSLAATLDELGQRQEARTFWKKALPLEKDSVSILTIEKRLRMPDENLHTPRR